MHDSEADRAVAGSDQKDAQHHAIGGVLALLIKALFG
jgi:hypothetical protein